MNLTINGAQHHLDVPPDAKLADLLRRELGLTGTKIGCGDGQYWNPMKSLIRR
jgi:aerobic-type carbon monoxide dehydrogenase small subunit (CoxS/CutS family)